MSILSNTPKWSEFGHSNRFPLQIWFLRLLFRYWIERMTGKYSSWMFQCNVVSALLSSIESGICFLQSICIYKVLLILLLCFHYYREWKIAEIKFSLSLFIHRLPLSLLSTSNMAPQMDSMDLPIRNWNKNI